MGTRASAWGLWILLVALWVLLQFAFPCKDTWASPVAAAVALGLPLAVALRLVPRPRSPALRVAGLLAVLVVTVVAGGLMLLSHVCM